MKIHFRNIIWRLIIYLLLLSLNFSTSGSISSLASPKNQENEPDVIAAPGDHLITNIILGPDTPNIIKINQNVTINFQYSTNEEAGVRIYARPYTTGAPTPSYAAHPSPLYPISASGKGSGWFTIENGKAVVDQVRLTMWNANQTTLLFEAYLPVHYFFSDSADIVTNIALIADTPDVHPFDQNVNLRFSYTASGNDSVRIFARPFTNGSLTPNYAAHGSPLYAPGNGSGTGSFTIQKGQVVVDQVRITMWNANQTTLLFDAFLPVYYRFRAPTHIVTNISFNSDTPNIFKYGGKINLTFSYETAHRGDVLIFARPFSGPGLSPDYAASPSPFYPTGSGTGSGYFQLNSGPRIADRVRIQMWNTDQTILLFETFLPVHLLWAGSGPPPGPDLRIDALEVTQAIQDLNNSIDLVAGKRTYVRMHVSTPTNINNVYATISGRRGFISLTPVLGPGNPGSRITVRTTPDRAQINDSFWFELPSSWTASGNLVLTARLDPNDAKNDLNKANNTKTVTVNFKSTPPLRLRLVNVQYTTGGSTYLTSSTHLNMLESWLRRVYPIPNLEVTRTTLIYPSSGLPNVDTLNSQLSLSRLFRIIFAGENPRTVYYGMVDDGGGFMRGKAAGIPGVVASGPTGSGNWGWDYDGSYGDWYGGHEIGHTRGRSHANFCGAAGGSAYPYANGRISPDLTGNGAVYGFDIDTRIIYGPNWKDVMTYCDNQWISDFTYEGIRDYLVSLGLAGAVTETFTSSRFLALVGLADLDQPSVSLSELYLLDQENNLPAPEPGDWMIVLLDSGDNNLASYPFEPDELTDAEDSPGRPAVIAEIIPWNDAAVKVEIRHQGSILASHSLSQNAPSVNLITPASDTILPVGPFEVTWTGSDPDGDTLTYSLLYTIDEGETWQTLATSLSGSGLELHTDLLPGGNGAMKIIVSDGLMTAQDTNSGLTLPLHPPSAQILSPEADQVFFPTQQIALLGTAYDLEDGDLPDDHFTWYSNLDGLIGFGKSVNIELTTGEHLITLEAIDNDGLLATVEKSITIAKEDAPVPLTLGLAPLVIVETVNLGSAPVQQALTLRSSSSKDLEWTSSEDILWLTIDTMSGETPTDLLVTIDATNLRIGTHTGVLTFASLEAENSPVQVLVHVQVLGRVNYLPLIAR
jgi:hypothetical protein